MNGLLDQRSGGHLVVIKRLETIVGSVVNLPIRMIIVSFTDVSWFMTKFRFSLLISFIVGFRPFRIFLCFFHFLFSPAAEYTFSKACSFRSNMEILDA